MNKPRIFLGSSGKQAKLLQAIMRGLEDIAEVEPWTTTFNPGRSTLDRLVELSQEVDFAAFVFAQDDWTTTDASQAGQASPRDNVVFEAGLFGGALGIRRTFILHANGSKLPSDLLGLTSVRYDPATSPAEVRAINQKLRKAIETEGRLGPVVERGCEGAPGSGRHLLLLEGRAPSTPGCPSARGHRRDQGGGRRPSDRVLDDTFGSRRRAERPNRRRLPSSRPLRPPGARRRERRRAGPAHRAAPAGMEVGRERILSTDRVSPPTPRAAGAPPRHATRRRRPGRRDDTRTAAGHRVWS